MSMSRTPGLGRDPRYHGKLGVPDYIINTPQKPAQWWAVALLVLLLALPFGVWSMLNDAGTLAIVGYAGLIALTAINAWILRNDINETLPFLFLAVGSGVTVLLGAAYVAAFEAFPDGDSIAGVLTAAAAVIAAHNIYRAWQGLLIIGLFTEQKVSPDSPYYKPPVVKKR